MTRRARERASTLAVLSAMALVVLDSGLLTVALPSLAEALAITPSSAILTVSAYQTALVIGLLPSAHLAERLGYRRVFVAGLGLFSAASLLCALSDSLSLLVAARAVQGLGGSAIMSLGIALLRISLGQHRLGTAISWNALTVALCAAAAPVLGAFILSTAPWPWLFFAKLPLCVLSLTAACRLPRVKPVKHGVDLPGILFHGATAVLIHMAIESMATRPVLSALLAGAATAMAARLTQRDRRRAAPLWPVDLLALRPVRVAAAASMCCFAGQSAGLLALAFYLQLGLGQGAVSAGLVMTCWPLMVAATAPVADRLGRRFGSPALCVAGGTVLGSGLLVCAFWPTGGQVAPLAIGSALAGIGFGLFQVPNNRTLFLTAPAERSAAAGGLQGSARLIGQTLGALVTGLLFSCVSTAVAPRAGLALGGLFAIMAALVSALELRIGPHGCRKVERPYLGLALVERDHP